MDGFREHPSEFDLPAAAETQAADDVTAAIGTDERRMHVRAYNYWVSLLDGRDYPSIEDLEPGNLSDFADHSVLLDFTSGRDDPATPYIGAAIREECGLAENVGTIADIPSRSLLSRLTDHYLQIIANRAPVGFEAEFVNQKGVPICYRGILMPFSSDGDTIDFIYGVINWKRAESGQSDLPVVPTVAAGELEPEEPAEFEPFAPEPAQAQEPHPTWDDGPLAEAADEVAVPEITLGDASGLADWLCAARETAEEVKSADHRSRAALYRALSRAYDFAIAAQRDPDDYAELLEESGVTAQARAPMTPIVKLLFGIDYDKTRLTEFASALSYAQRQQVALGGFEAIIEQQPGGLKALVAAERQARRPGARTDTRTEAARERLRAAGPMSLQSLPDDEEFCLVLTRRGPDGVHEPVAVISDPALVDRAIRRAA
ncbi:MAG: PAS domain-containing protein [Sphingomicrobium sp.]